MAGAGMREISSSDAKLDELRAAVSKQGASVRWLKSAGRSQEEVTAAVDALKELKVALEEQQKKSAPEKCVDRAGLETSMLRRMIVVPSFEIHGGEKGLFDFGPVGCALKDNILSLWKNHFILQESMLQIEGTCLTPEPVLKASGHVDRFTDLMVKDITTGACYRADKLLESHIENYLEKTNVSAEERAELERIHRQADAYSEEEIDQLIRERFQIKAPDTGKELSKPFPFNLMFATTIGPEGTSKGYLRPETAQGIFVNFKRLLEYNNGRIPFAAAQIGLGFRNEISPRAGLLRVREFCMAEIEHFCEADKKEHLKFDQVADVELTLFPRDRQVGDGKMLVGSAGEAVKQGIVMNETLAYYMARTQLFLLKIGIKSDRLRFRQHLSTEMAHYAQDCWDAEILMSYGWIECAGHADRSCYDLQVHSEVTGVELVASRRVDPPREQEVAKLKLNKGLVGKTFKKEAATLIKTLEGMDVDTAMQTEAKLAADGEAEVESAGKKFTVQRPMVSFSKGIEKVHTETFFPHVIEPSFGIGRLIYAVLEHNYYARDESKQVDKGSVQRTVFSFKPLVAPVKCAVFPLQKKEEFLVKVTQLTSLLIAANLSTQSDTSSIAIGRRYARMDEIGVPFALTVDGDTLAGKGPTIRERDSTEQIRVPEDELISTLQGLCSEQVSWKQVSDKFGLIVTSAE